LGAGAVVPVAGVAVVGVAVVGLASVGAASVVAVAVVVAPSPLFGAWTGFVAVVRSLALREARPGSVSLGMRTRGMSDLPSGMAPS
jgi:hypothetical protein